MAIGYLHITNCDVTNYCSDNKELQEVSEALYLCRNMQIRASHCSGHELFKFQGRYKIMCIWLLPALSSHYAITCHHTHTQYF